METCSHAKIPNKCAAIAASAVAAFPPGNQDKYTPSASVSSAVDLLSLSNKALDSSKNQCKIWRQQQHPLLPKPTNYNPVYPLQQPHPTNNINITMVSTTKYPSSSSSSSIRKLSSFYHSLLQHQPQHQQPQQQQLQQLGIEIHARG